MGDDRRNSVGCGLGHIPKKMTGGWPIMVALAYNWVQTPDKTDTWVVPGIGFFQTRYYPESDELEITNLQCAGSKVSMLLWFDANWRSFVQSLSCQVSSLVCQTDDPVLERFYVRAGFHREGDYLVMEVSQ